MPFNIIMLKILQDLSIFKIENWIIRCTNPLNFYPQLISPVCFSSTTYILFHILNNPRYFLRDSEFEECRDKASDHTEKGNATRMKTRNLYRFEFCWFVIDKCELIKLLIRMKCWTRQATYWSHIRISDIESKFIPCHRCVILANLFF